MIWTLYLQSRYIQSIVSRNDRRTPRKDINVYHIFPLIHKIIFTKMLQSIIFPFRITGIYTAMEKHLVVHPVYTWHIAGLNIYFAQKFKHMKLGKRDVLKCHIFCVKTLNTLDIQERCGSTVYFISEHPTHKTLKTC